MKHRPKSLGKTNISSRLPDLDKATELRSRLYQKGLGHK